MQKKVLTAVPTLGIARTSSALLSLKRHSQGSTHQADPLFCAEHKINYKLQITNYDLQCEANYVEALKRVIV